MLVRFNSTNFTEIMDTQLGIYTKIFVGGPYKVPTVSTPYGGVITNADEGGSFLGYNAGAGKAYIVWRTASNATQTYWEMDSSNAADAAIANLGTAYASDPDSYVVLSSDGTVTAGS